MFKKSLILLVVLSWAIAGGVSAQSDPIRIGAIFDLSGSTSDVGRPYAEGVAAYVDFVNSNGGINGREIELLGADSGNSVNTAVSIYRQAVAQGAVAVMGWGTDDTQALVGEAADDGIPFISASYSDSLDDPNGDAPYNFVIATTYGDQIELLMEYMVELWEDDGNSAADMSVAIFYDDSAFGVDPLRQAAEAADWLGLGGALSLRMPRGATDYTAELQQADDYGVTHVVIQSTTGPAAVLVRNINDFFGGSVVVGCLNWCANEQFVARAGGAAEGVLGAMPFTPTSVQVAGQDDPREYLAARGLSLTDTTLNFTQGWAAMSLLVEAITQVSDAGSEVSGPNIRAALESFDEVDTGTLLPPVSFSPNDHSGTSALVIYVVENGEWVESSGLLDLD